jgi:hypothetical protein
MLGLTTHLSMPACVHEGDWAAAGAASTAISASAAKVEQRLIIGWLLNWVSRAVPGRQ